ncbi:MAG: L,D-transpeptidase family protein [Pseudomonadota bacterium]
MTDLTVISSDHVMLSDGRRLRCAIGKGGFVADKKEGDGGTPVGSHRLLQLLYRPDRIEGSLGTELPSRPLTPSDGWCDDPDHADYNTAIHLPHPARHERLWREDRVYDLIIVTDQNTSPVVKGAGSAIFVHLARENYAPTEGCVALNRDDFFLMLRLLTQESRLVVPEDLAPR